MSAKAVEPPEPSPVVTDFGAIVGHATVLDMLRRLLASGRVPQALLFHGPDGIGKATVARIFAASLLCEAGGEDPCGSCESCRMLGHGSHPDQLLVELLPKEGSAGRAGELRTQIIIDQIRKLTSLAGLTPREGRHRVFIIDPADRMNREAQNALLKTLEEPPGASVLVLVSSRPHLLLPTVRSRCMALGFSALRATELSRLLQDRGMDADEAGARAALAAGRVGAAIELDVEEMRERRDELLSMLEALSAGKSIAEIPAAAAALAGKHEQVLLDNLELLQGLLRDVARTGRHGGETALIHADLAARLRRLEGRLGSARAAALVARVDRLRGYLRFNTNRVLLAESLLAAVAGGPLPG